MTLTDAVAIGDAWDFTSDTEITFNTTATVPAGGLLVVEVAADNLGTGTTTPSPTMTITGGGLTWTQRFDRGSGSAAGSGVVGSLHTAPAPAGLASGTTLTCTLSGAVAAKAIRGWYVATATVAAISVVEAGDNTFTASLSITPTAEGQMVWGVCAREAAITATFAQDADTTNGSWVDHPITGLTQAQAGGAAAAAVSLVGAHKIVTASGAQTYNPTASGGGGDFVGAVLVLEEVASTPVRAPFGRGRIRIGWPGRRARIHIPAA